MGRKRKDVPDLCFRKDGSMYVSDPTRLTPAGKPTQVRIRDRDHYEEWRRDYLERTRTPVPPAPPKRCTVDELCDAFLAHAKVYYRKCGRPTGALGVFRAALRHMLSAWGGRDASGLAARDMLALQNQMVAAGLARTTVNALCGRVKAVVRWGVRQGSVDEAALMRLRSVEGLKRGRTAARETGRVRAVSAEHVEAVLPHLKPTYCAMARLQFYGGARPGEIRRMRLCWVDRSGPVWVYHVPEDLDKTAHHRRREDPGRTVYFGPKAQAVLRPLLTMDPDRPLFRGRTGREADAAGYRKALAAACAKAGIPPFRPNQIRHARATLIRRSRYGLEGAQVFLGHDKAETTEIYAESDSELAVQIAMEMG